LKLLQGAEDKHSHYVRLFLYNGSIYVLVKGKKKVEMMRETSYADNNWHRVSITLQNK